MKPLRFNFSQQAVRRQRRRDWTILVLSVLLLVFIGREALSLQQELQRQQTKQRQQVQQTQITAPVDQEQQKLARNMADSLNLPWYDLLEAMESVKQQHPDVFLNSLLPDARKQQVVMSGQVKQLDQLLGFIDDLNRHQLFSDALLVNQQQLALSDGMGFTLKLVWRHE